jgi:hypothetical protein
MTTTDKVYTQKEVLKYINIFRDREDEVLNKRKELNKELFRIRKQKEYWENLDISQLKLI